MKKAYTAIGIGIVGFAVVTAIFIIGQKLQDRNNNLIETQNHIINLQNFRLQVDELRKNAFYNLIFNGTADNTIDHKQIEFLDLEENDKLKLNSLLLQFEEENNRLETKNNSQLIEELTLGCRRELSEAITDLLRQRIIFLSKQAESKLQDNSYLLMTLLFTLKVMALIVAIIFTINLYVIFRWSSHQKIELKRTEDLIKIRTIELENRIDDLQQFSYAVSHDIQEPVRMLASFSTLLRKGLTTTSPGLLTEENSNYLTHITESAKHLQTMINDLLVLTRIEKEVECVSIPSHKILKEVLFDLSGVINEKQATVIICSHLPEIRFSSVRLKQILFNLISNSLKFSNKNQIVIKIDCRSHGSFWLFSVWDNGIGIAKKHESKIFQIFNRLNGLKYSGTGVGLVLCKKIIKSQGGNIWFESNPEIKPGTTFFFTIRK